MNEYDLTELGKEIGKRIEKTMQSAMEGARHSAEDALFQVSESLDKVSDSLQRRDSGMSGMNGATGTGGAAGAGGTPEAPGMNGATGRNAAPRSEQGKSLRERYEQQKKNIKLLPVVKSPEGKTKGTLLMIFGCVGALMFSTTALRLMLYAFWDGSSITALFPAGVFVVLVTACVIAAFRGDSILQRIKRFHAYVAKLREKEYIEISKLAQEYRKKEKFIIKDLQTMMERGWFREGHFDDNQTCFIVTNEAYRLYRQAQEELKHRLEEEEQRKQEEERIQKDPTQLQLRQTIEEGQAYIAKIREVNQDLDDPLITEKLNRLEFVCQRIFTHVESNPGKLGDIRKFMQYYLPMTLKLVVTYREFSTQEVQGDTIQNTAKEMEESLDKVNLAFEKMFDKLFEEEAMDVSADISVLNTMLAQEGLLEDDWN